MLDLTTQAQAHLPDLTALAPLSETLRVNMSETDRFHETTEQGDRGQHAEPTETRARASDGNPQGSTGLHRRVQGADPGGVRRGQQARRDRGHPSS